MIVHTILRRFHLVRLGEHQQSMMKTFLPLTDDQVHVRQSIRVQDEMMRLAYPDVPAPADESEDSSRYEELHKRLAKNWPGDGNGPS